MIENSNFFSEIEILFSKNEDDPSGKNERDGEREKNENEEERKGRKRDKEKDKEETKCYNNFQQKTKDYH